MWESDDDLWNSSKMYAYAFTDDPITHHNLGPGNPFEGLVSMGENFRLVATKNHFNTDPEKFIKKYRELTNLSTNCVFVLEKHGDILYFPGGGIVPIR